MWENASIFPREKILRINKSSIKLTYKQVVMWECYINKEAEQFKYQFSVWEANMHSWNAIVQTKEKFSISNSNPSLELDNASLL